MANKRVIKKDIDFMVNEVITDCYTHLLLHGEKSEDKIVEIIQQLVDKRNDLFDRVNNPNKENKTKEKSKLKRTNPEEFKATVLQERKETKQHYRAVYNDLLAIIDESFGQLADLSK